MNQYPLRNDYPEPCYICGEPVGRNANTFNDVHDVCRIGELRERADTEGEQ